MKNFSLRSLILLMASFIMIASCEKEEKADGAVPAVPDGLRAVLDSANRSADLYWNTEEGLDYELVVENTSYTAFGVPVKVPGLDYNVDYSWQVRAKKGDIYSKWSEGSTFRIDQAEIIPVPTDLQSVFDDNDNVTLSWSIKSGYICEIDVNGQTYTTTASTYLIPKADIEPNTDYTWKVRAKAQQSDNYSTWSKTDEFRFSFIYAPGGLQHQNNNGTFTLSWNAVEGISQYIIDVNGATYTIYATTWTVENITPNTDYTWKVRAKKGKELSDWSQSVFRFISTPTGLAFTIDPSGNVILSWTALPDYTYEVKVDNGYTNSTSAGTYQVLGAEKTPNTDYTWEVRARKGNETGEWTQSTFRIISITTPTGLHSIFDNDDNIVLNWTGAPGYTYEIAVDGASYTSSAASYVFLTEDKSAKEYTWKVRAIDSENNYSVWSEESTFVIEAEGVVSVPSGLSYQFDANSDVTLRWTTLNVDSYEIDLNGKTYTINTNQYNLNNPSTGTYTWKIRAKKEGVYSSWSAESTFVVLAFLPRQVQSPLVNADGSITLRWDPTTGVSGYEIVVGGVPYYTTETTYQIEAEALTPGTDYTWKVRAKDGNNYSRWTSGLAFRTKELLKGTWGANDAMFKVMMSTTELDLDEMMVRNHTATPVQVVIDADASQLKIGSISGMDRAITGGSGISIDSQLAGMLLTGSDVTGTVSGSKDGINSYNSFTQNVNRKIRDVPAYRTLIESLKLGTYESTALNATVKTLTIRVTKVTISGTLDNATGKMTYTFTYDIVVSITHDISQLLLNLAGVDDINNLLPKPQTLVTSPPVECTKQ
jgi:predicted secreted protein